MESNRAANLRDTATAVVERMREKLVGVSHAIHAEPELAFSEVKAAALLGAALEREGRPAQLGPWGLETALVSTAGAGPIRVAICAEYDALPGLGHACGHNIIAAAALGAYLAIAEVASEAGVEVRLIGTPAEEAGNASGKMLLLERGAFDDVDAAMMVHPGPYDLLRPNMIAAMLVDVEYTGKESHAASHPELGINAADALVVAQVGIGLLRQQLLPTDRVHGIVTLGGEAPNIIPADAQARYMIRANAIGRLGDVKQRVLACFEAGATATGAALTVLGGDHPYAQMVHNDGLAELYRRNAESLGRRFMTGEAAERPFGSTDMGNVSLMVPSIHPFVGIGSLPAVNHQPEFAEHCVSKDADAAVMDAAIAMAHTVIDLGTHTDPRAVLASG